MVLPNVVQKLIEAFERLPGIGPKTAARLAFYLLCVPQEELDRFAQAIGNLKKQTVRCSTCFNISETDPCPICQDAGRDKTVICVVEQPLDILALEKTGKYKGLYHVLGGAINPLQNIGPDELYIKELLARLRPAERGFGEVEEIILATNPTMEGEATAMYVAKKIRELKTPAFAEASAFGSTKSGLRPTKSAGKQSSKLKITRLGQGLPTGGDLEYADEVTLTRALEGRREY